jgi:hypothetical protein
MCSSSVANSNMIGALFQDSTANALAADVNGSAAATAICLLHIKHIMAAGTTSATTFKVRIGNNSANTLTFNGGDGVGATIFGATTKSSLTITEYKS